MTLALRRRQPILTLDAEVVERGTTAFPELRVFGRDGRGASAAPVGASAGTS